MTSYIKHHLFLLSLFLCQNMLAQNSKNIPANLTYYSTLNISINERSELDNVLSQNLSPIDLTEKLQDYINKNDRIVLPNRDMILDKTGLNISSNKVLIFQKRSRLIMRPNALDSYGIINVVGASNVNLINPNLVGDRYKHLKKTGEWGHGIRILGSRNITVENFHISDCWGDGIYIGRNGKSQSYNIKISSGVVTNNRRNGISVTSVDGLNMKNITAAFSNGTNPQYGIDFEANGSTDVMNNILMTNINTYYNTRGGMMISFNRMSNNGNAIKNVNFDINGFTDTGSNEIGLLIAQISNKFKSLKGGIRIKNLNVDKNLKPIIIRRNDIPTFKIEMDNVNITNPKNRNFTNREFLRVNQEKSNIKLRVK